MRARLSFMLIVFVWLVVMHGVMSAQTNTGRAANSGQAVAVDITYTVTYTKTVPPSMWTRTPDPRTATYTRTPYYTRTPTYTPSPTTPPTP